MATITITDTSISSEESTWSLDLFEETLSLRELIRRRIYQEVSEYNAQLSVPVQSTSAEDVPDTFHLKTPQRLDWEAQYEKAIDAFHRRSYIVLVNGKQITDLDTDLELHAGVEATFFKLTPLVGG